MLKRLRTDYIDIGMIHYVDSMKAWDEVENGGVMEYAEELKREGKIKHIGMSSHNPLVAMKAVKSGRIEVLMFSINPCYDLQPADEDVEKLWADESYAAKLTNMDPDREKLYEECLKRGVGITVMKVFGGGDLLDAKLSPVGVALTAPQCIHYALTRPAVSSVMSGAHSVKELAESLSYETATKKEKDYAAALSTFPKISWEGHCMYCGHCAPCPKKIDIAAVTKFLNLAKAQKKVPETVREHYAALSHRADECVECGQCEKRCPFRVAVRKNMKEAVKVFGKEA
jgi:predicted aldo/keto reductase-like oxidoreductase